MSSLAELSDEKPRKSLPNELKQEKNIDKNDEEDVDLKNTEVNEKKEETNN